MKSWDCIEMSKSPTMITTVFQFSSYTDYTQTFQEVRKQFAGITLVIFFKLILNTVKNSELSFFFKG